MFFYSLTIDRNHYRNPILKLRMQKNFLVSKDMGDRIPGPVSRRPACISYLSLVMGNYKCVSFKGAVLGPKGNSSVLFLQSITSFSRICSDGGGWNFKTGKAIPVWDGLSFMPDEGLSDAG